MPLNVLVVTKGHRFDYNGFYAMFDEDPGLNATVVEQPAAQVILRPEFAAEYDALLFYDMWGVYPGADGAFPQPSPDYARAVEGLLDQGKGMVLLNHALVQWPAWPLWREISGTSFLLRETVLDGVLTPGSGYRGGGGEPHRNVNHHLSPVAPGHPVLAGLEDGFDIVDELYTKTDRFERNPDIVPLLRTTFDMSQENFNPPPMAPAEEKARWQHPRGSDLMAWAKRTRNSPVVAMDGGDGPEAYANPAFRRFLSNALHWVASEEARAWARNR